MKLLVLSTSYPREDNVYQQYYVHSRCIEYKKLGIDVKVLNFSATTDYIYEGVRVLTLKSVLDLGINSFEVYASHAPNLREHFKILRKLNDKSIFFFIHGHEVLRSYGDYPEPYWWYSKENKAKVIIKRVYDELKLRIFPFFVELLSKKNRIHYIFVSDWMKRKFEENIGAEHLDKFSFSIIPNSVNRKFSEEKYHLASEKAADFITVRPLDGSKYAVDLVIEFALANPDRTFHVYGKGQFFHHVSKPANVTWFAQFVEPKNMTSLLNRYQCALMPTRYDSQGVMMCEMAAYGIPLITTDIYICKEMLGNFSNVTFLSESDFSSALIEMPSASTRKRQDFDAQTLAEKEIATLKENN